MELTDNKGFDPFGTEKYVFCENTTKNCVVNEEHLLSVGVKPEIESAPFLNIPCFKPLATILSANYDAVELLYLNSKNELQSILGVRKGKVCGLINLLGVQVFPLIFSNIICPINSSKPVFCVNRFSDHKWAAIDIFGEIIVPFGSYVYMWGFDHDHCLVSTSAGTFEKRAIIGINGEILISPDKYVDIYSFRGKSLIKVEDHAHNYHNLSIATLIEIARSNQFHPTHNEIEKSRINQSIESFHNDEPGMGRYDEYGGYNGYDDFTINSAFDGDPEATWNVD